MMTTEINDTETPEVTVPARFLELKQLVAAMESDFDKFYNHGNKAAGTRVRLAMQELKSFAQTVRNEVQTIKNEGSKDAGGEGQPD